MEGAVDIRGVVKHIVDGTLDENLCRVCLQPFGEVCENIYTTVIKGDQEFRVADVLRNVCQLEISGLEQSNVCANCFNMSAVALKFCCLAKCSDELLHFYVNQLEANALAIETPNDVSEHSVCITLPEVQPRTAYLDLDPRICAKNLCVDDATVPYVSSHTSSVYLLNTKEIEEESIVLVVKDKDSHKQVVETSKRDDEVPKNMSSMVRRDNKVRKKRSPMVYTKCSKCPVKYRFLAKLKEHMKADHNIDLYVCRICKAKFEVELDFNIHLKTHTNVLCCHICNATFKKRDTIISHLRSHDEANNFSNIEGAYVCEQCGSILPDEEKLQEHYSTKHDKKYKCYYCGRMYKGENSFEMHIKKHEVNMKPELKRQSSVSSRPARDKSKDQKRISCSTCGKHFVDERALMWHTMLHTNERPFKCSSCGRSFVSANRRNQHALCAHSVPTRRCPLCPALFHLTSMVNTHIKKVHLTAHKRRNRASKHQNVHWRTEPVPLQELSVDIQTELLELQSRTEEDDCVLGP